MTLTVQGLANPSQGLQMLQQTSSLGIAIPVASRKDTMSLNTLRAEDGLRGRVQCLKDDTQALRTHDIDGAQPAYRSRTLYRSGGLEKDVPGTTARAFNPSANRPVDLSLTTRDIDGAQPNVATFKTPRCVNPLTPRYDLPTCNVELSAPSSQRIHEGQPRDTLAFKGEPKVKPVRDLPRDPNDHRDIEHSVPSSRSRLGSAAMHDIFRTVERAGDRSLSTKCATPRVTCPLDPVYTVPSCTTHPLRHSEREGSLAANQAGPVEGATSRVLHRELANTQASVIQGGLETAVPQRYKGTVAFNLYDPPEVTPYARSLGLDCSDIDGTQTGTRRRGPR